MSLASIGFGKNLVYPVALVHSKVYSAVTLHGFHNDAVGWSSWQPRQQGPTPMMSVDPLEVLARGRIGRVLRGRWMLETVLGIGGMATVYAATHRNGLRGAVKMLHPEMALNDDARQRFLREGYVANRLERGAVKVLDDDTTEEGEVYLVMELLEGRTLEEMAAKRPSNRLQPGEVVNYAIQLLETLSFAHAAGIVHRDIKPENLFLTNEGDLRVLDFGIARLREQTGGNVKATSTTVAMGTPAFMPPEQARSLWSEVGPRSDIYSVGATMFTLLSGANTHEADSAMELMMAVASRPARPLASLLPSVPIRLAAIVDRALSFKQDARFPEAKAMQKELMILAQFLTDEDSDVGSDRTLAVPQSVSSVSLATPSRPMPRPTDSSPSTTQFLPVSIPSAPVSQSGPLSTGGFTAAPHSVSSPHLQAPLPRSRNTTLAWIGVAMGVSVTAMVLLASAFIYSRWHPAIRATGSNVTNTVESTGPLPVTAPIPELDRPAATGAASPIVSPTASASSPVTSGTSSTTASNGPETPTSKPRKTKKTPKAASTFDLGRY